MFRCKVTFEILFETEDLAAKLTAESHVGRFGWIGSHRSGGLPTLIIRPLLRSHRTRPSPQTVGLPRGSAPGATPSAFDTRTAVVLPSPADVETVGRAFPQGVRPSANLSVARALVAFLHRPRVPFRKLAGGRSHPCR